MTLQGDFESVNETIRITRRELYEKVWQTPMAKLAAEFCRSDVGLAKVCKLHQIPVPGRGYWARLSAGQNPKRKLLPNLATERIEIVLRKTQKPEAAPAMPDRPVPVIEVSDTRSITHRHVMRIDKSVLRGKKDSRGLPLSRQRRILPVNVSLNSLARALRILDALFVAFEDAGHRIQWDAPYTSPIIVIVLNEKIGFSMSEIIERTQHKITTEETARQKQDTWWTPQRWDHALTGRLRFALQSIEASHIQHVWADGKRQKLEGCVGEMLVGFEDTASAVKKYRDDCAEAERQRIVEQKREDERRRRQAEYDRKMEAVAKFAAQWREANELREFAGALKENLGSPTISMEQKLGVVRILDWIERHANYIDPLTDIRHVISEFHGRRLT